MLNCKNNCLKNKKAQVGQTLFWLLATIVIIVILVFFILASISMSTLKDINLLLASKANSDLKGDSQILTKKTMLAEELNNANKNKIEEILKLI